MPQDPSGYIVVRPSAEHDPDGSKLRGTLQAQLGLERAQGLRELMLHVLAIVSIPLGVMLMMAGAAGPPAGIRALLLAGWGAGLAGLAIAGASEWKYRRKRAALLDELSKLG